MDDVYILKPAFKFEESWNVATRSNISLRGRKRC